MHYLHFEKRNARKQNLLLKRNTMSFLHPSDTRKRKRKTGSGKTHQNEESSSRKLEFLRNRYEKNHNRVHQNRRVNQVSSFNERHHWFTSSVMIFHSSQGSERNQKSWAEFMVLVNHLISGDQHWLLNDKGWLAWILCLMIPLRRKNVSETSHNHQINSWSGHNRIHRVHQENPWILWTSCQRWLIVNSKKILASKAQRSWLSILIA